MSCQHEVLETETLKSTDDQACMNEGKKSSSDNGNVDQESKEVPEYMISKSGKTSRKRKHIEENDGRGVGLVSPAKRQAVTEMVEGLPDHMHLEPISECGTTNSRIKEGPSVVDSLCDECVTNMEECDSREEEKHQRESDVRQRGHMGCLDSATGSSYRTNAPCLDEVNSNHVRMGSLGSEPPTVSRSGTPERRVPQPGYGVELLGFASGLHHAFSRRHSAGWLTE